MLIFPLLTTLLLVFFTTSLLIHNKLASLRYITYPLAFALTISSTSYLYYLSLLFRISYPSLLAALAIPCFAVTALLLRRESNSWSFPKLNKSWSNFILLIGILILTIRFNKYVYRWGDWDAWAIWTLHAKFLFYPEYWTNMFTNKLESTHPDYPLMLPSLIAFIWRGIEYITPIVPIIIANVVLLIIPTSVYTTLRKSSYHFLAIFSIIFFAVDTKFIHLAGSQYADTLLSFFILLTFILYKQSKTPTILFLLGIITAASTWIKNEGLLFFLVFSCVYIYFKFKQPRTILYYIAGTLIPILILIHFKLTLAPANDLVHANRGTEIITSIASQSRYILIIKHFILTSITYYWIILVLLTILILRKNSFYKTLPFIVFALMLIGYFVIYLTTPNDLDWHLGASLDRLFHHIYPTSLLLLLLKLDSFRLSFFGLNADFNLRRN